MSNDIQEVTGLKICKECGRLLPLTSFGKYNKYKDGLYPKCKECTNRLQREYRDENREHVNQNAREYYAENREHLRQCQNEWRDENREHVRQQKRDWYDKNREHINQQTREYNAENREHLRQWKREWLTENREYANQYQREWYAENREILLQRQADQYQNDPIYRRKKIVRGMTMKAVYRGDLIRPTNCEICGSDEHAIQAHHESYEPGFELDVRWVCRFCHAKIHMTFDD